MDYFAGLDVSLRTCAASGSCSPFASCSPFGRNRTSMDSETNGDFKPEAALNVKPIF
ncbi:hypothetical protein [Yoonia sediminilitoris]|uniref:Uncharacterized protein n=1 Tax=Yoonia sediminilitoris TaxID=1286148 RepID=A0A2T6K946_9RHOB|nr:hypothetical protein [Yoonia sediminilitoris]PUB11271.1 hypothetical protein C8N45_11443 [Yoonia sediminilitoris]RCW91087.1 hypothetical protein DFP92_11443 [Yoonia sediminilitoris]